MRPEATHLRPRASHSGQEHDAFSWGPSRGQSAQGCTHFPMPEPAQDSAKILKIIAKLPAVAAGRFSRQPLGLESADDHGYGLPIRRKTGSLG